MACGSGLSAWKSTVGASTGWASARVGLGSRGIDVVGIKTELVVNLPLLGIAQNVVGFREGLELFLGSFVPGIYVRMIFAGKFAERLANVVRRGRLLYPEKFVIIFFSGGCHRLVAISTRCVLGDQKPRRKPGCH